MNTRHCMATGAAILGLMLHTATIAFAQMAGNDGTRRLGVHKQDSLHKQDTAGRLDSVHGLDEVVVTAKRPLATVQQLTGKELQSLSSTSIADALKYFAGVQIKRLRRTGRTEDHQREVARCAARGSVHRRHTHNQRAKRNG